MVLSILKIPTNPLCWVIETILFLSEIYVFMGMEKDSGRFWNNTKHTKSFIDDNISALNFIHISIYSTTESFLNTNLNSKRNTTEILFIWEYYIYPISNSVLIPLKLLQRRHEQNLLTFIYFRLCTWMVA